MATARASNWSDVEIKQLICIWADSSVQAILQGKKRNTSAYEQICEKLKESGYTRTKEQVQVRTKNKMSSRQKFQGSIPEILLVHVLK